MHPVAGVLGKVVRGMVLALLALALPLHAAQPAGVPPKTRTVVILHSWTQENPGLREMNLAIAEGLQKGSVEPVEVYSEYSGLDRYNSPTYADHLLALYREKYARRKVDLLIAVGATAVDFAVQKGFLADTPMVTCYVGGDQVMAARKIRPELTATLHEMNAPKTLELMLALYPATRRIHVVLGASEYERAQAGEGRYIFEPFARRVDIDYWNDLTLEQMEGRMRSLPDEDLVLFASLLQDASGRNFATNEPLRRLSAASRRPVFGDVAEDLGDGILGGILLSMERAGAAAGQVGLEVLRGTAAAKIPPRVNTGAAPMFDWRHFKRWGVKEGRLPKGSIIRFREVGLWDTYWKEISLALGIILVESLLVAGLVVQLRRRKRVERELAEARTRYRTVADFTHDWEYWQRPDGSFDYVSPACERVTGHPAPAFKADPDLLGALVLEEDRPRWRAYQAEALISPVPTGLEYRICTRAGEIRWVDQANNPVRLPGDQAAGTRGSIRDITARKQAELDLQRAYTEIGALKDQLEAENTYYREKIQAVEGSSSVVGQSDPIKYLLYRIRQVAPSDTTVLIQGETGTGKELVAESIHQLGGRADRPLVKLNCAALPPGLAESELFGHEKGAFTGAASQRKGRFELADGGTLFLDEVGELSPDVQAKLLRVLQDGTFQRVGGTRTLQADVRLVAATNRDLAKEVAAGRFREDLWYRLNVFPITVPPLRSRKEDIPLLVQAFLERLCPKMGRAPLQISRSVLQSLQDYSWPGNVRELQNVIEQAVLVSDGPTLRLPDRLGAGRTDLPTQGPLRSLLEVERDHILQVLEATGWKLEGPQGAADLLGLKPSTLRSRMQKLEIGRREE